MHHDWTNIGKTETNGRQAELLGYFARMDWLKVPTPEEPALSLPMMPGEGIKAAIRQLGIPRVSHVSYSHDMAPYGLYGIFGHYKNADVKVYLCDRGSDMFPICMEVEDKTEEPTKEAL